MNQLSLENVDLERRVNEKENVNHVQAQALKELEKKQQALNVQKDELEKVNQVF